MLTTADKFTFVLRQTAEGTANTAQVGFTVDRSVGSHPGNPGCIALMIAYLNRAGVGVMTGNVFIDEVLYQAHGAAGAFPQPFPTADWAALVSEFPALPALATGYATSISGGTTNLAPIGTSCCVTERTAFAGRTGIGRHYLPFAEDAQINNATGLWAAGATGYVTAAYTTFLLTPTTSMGTVPGMCVTNVNGTPTHLITTVTPSETPSNLRSRRR
jgi:hypothetical protein